MQEGFEPKTLIVPPDIVSKKKQEKPHHKWSVSDTSYS